ncbi:MULTISPECIES: hypothetical protein [unclassified Nocardiopsis]|nr:MULTISPECIES: hypothetical protein [unclassified Nocardiopsis]
MSTSSVSPARERSRPAAWRRTLAVGAAALAPLGLRALAVPLVEWT